jgi:hypothetical protein
MRERERYQSGRLAQETEVVGVERAELRLQRRELAAEIRDRPIVGGLFALREVTPKSIAFLGNSGQCRAGLAQLASETVDVGELACASGPVGGLAFGVIGPFPGPAASLAGFAVTVRAAVG